MISFSIQKNFIYIPFFITSFTIQKSVLETFKLENGFSKLIEFSLKITLINVYLIEKRLLKNEKKKNNENKGKNIIEILNRKKNYQDSFFKKIKENKSIKLLFCIIILNLCYYKIKDYKINDYKINEEKKLMDDYFLFIILLFFIDLLIFGNEVYSHQILTTIINIIGIIIYYCLIKYTIKLRFIFLLLTCYCRAFNRLLLRYISINYFINIYLIVSILGITGLFYLLINFIFDHNFIQFPDFNNTKIFYILILFIVSSLINYFLYYKIIYELGPIHIYIGEFIGFFIYQRLFKNEFTDIIIFIIFIISSLIYCEIIILNFCGLNKNTKINVEKRALNDFNELINNNKDSFLIEDNIFDF